LHSGALFPDALTRKTVYNILFSRKFPDLEVSITIDAEQDCPPYLRSYRGFKDGIPLLLKLLREEGIRGTFFVTGEAARRFPDIVRTISSDGHEIGCHGDTHRRFSDMDVCSARDEINAATRTLRSFYPVKSFRAPNLDFPSVHLPLLSDAGYALDSSQGRHKPECFFVNPTKVHGLRRIPVSIAPSALRLPLPVRRFLLGQLRAPAVLFFHPWEFVDMSREPIPYDCRYRTGAPAIDALRDAIQYFRAREASFLPMEALA
jgi:peptidoglycan/xylan/chitin deacetylase (PgdA/CDA1 family)